MEPAMSGPSSGLGRPRPRDGNQSGKAPALRRSKGRAGRNAVPPTRRPDAIVVEPPLRSRYRRVTTAPEGGRVSILSSASKWSDLRRYWRLYPRDKYLWYLSGCRSAGPKDILLAKHHNTVPCVPREDVATYRLRGLRRPSISTSRVAHFLGCMPRRYQGRRTIAGYVHWRDLGESLGSLPT